MASDLIGSKYNWKFKEESLLTKFYFARVYNNTIVDATKKGIFIGWKLWVDKTTGEYSLICLDNLIDTVKSMNLSIIEDYISNFDRLHDYERKMFNKRNEVHNE